MNKHNLLPVLALAAFAQATSAAININGSVTYTQDFNTLPTADTTAGVVQFDWTDDVTIPGFYLHRSNTPAGQTSLAGTRSVNNERPHINDGSRAANGTPNFHGFLSLGPSNDPERALGYCPTTTDGGTNWAGGTLSIIAVFTNTGTTSVELSQLTYDVENWFPNTDTAVAETIGLTYKTGDAATLIAELGNNATGAAFSVPGYNAVNAGSFDLTSSDGFSTPATPGSTTRTGFLFPAIRIVPGESLVLRWGNPNDGGADAQVGIDNLSATFTSIDASISPVISNVVRNDNGTPGDPSDDTVGFDLDVAGIGAVSAGWKISSPFSLSTVTGTYGVPQTITGVSVSEFSDPLHTLDIFVEDSANPLVAATVTLTAPWCQITPVINNVSRDGQGDQDPSNDTWGYTITVNGQFGGTGFTSTSADIPNPGTYGTTYVVSGIPIAFSNESITFTDIADIFCTATVNLAAPRVIGEKNFGTSEPLFNDGNPIPLNWVVDETLLTQSMNNGGGAPPKEYRSEVIDLTAIAEVQFSGTLFVNDTSSGHEADDTFNAYLIVDGDTANPISLITPFDTIAPANGILTGPEITPSVPGPPPTSGPGTYTHNFNAVVPAAANSVQLVITANNNSASETMTMQNLLFKIADHSIFATLAPGVQFDNKGTVSPADDDFRQGVNITAISPPPGSTGWNSTSTPASGLYSAPNPVFFGPYLQTAAALDVIFTDNAVPAVTTTVNIAPPTPAIVTTYVANSLARDDKGTADPADDTVTAQFDVSAPVGGPSFVLEMSPGNVTANSTALSATPQTITFTFTDVPSSGSLFFTIRDASYPTSSDTWELTPNAVIVSEYVLAKKNLGGGLSNVVTLAGSTLPPEWTNYPSVPAVQMNNGAPAPEKVLTSEVVDLSGVSGPVNFTANLRVTDFTSGFEAADTFKAELILDGDTANPVNLVATYDLDTSGAMNGAELAPALPVNGIQVNNYPISAVIPDSVNSVQLVITGLNDSDNEMMVFEDALFSIGTPVSDSDGDGQTDESEAVAGTDPNDPNDYLRITGLTPGAGSVDMTFPSKSGKNYQAEISNLLESGWTSLGPVIPGTGGLITVPIAPVPTPGEDKGFLRVRVVP